MNDFDFEMVLEFGDLQISEVGKIFIQNAVVVSSFMEIFFDFM